MVINIVWVRVISLWPVEKEVLPHTVHVTSRTFVVILISGIVPEQNVTSSIVGSVIVMTISTSIVLGSCVHKKYK